MTLTKYACPFCGELFTGTPKGNHLGMHRKAGLAPLPITAEITQNEQGLWDISLVLDSGDAVFVPLSAQNRKSKSASEKTLRLLLGRIAHGSGRSATHTVVKQQSVAEMPVEQVSLVEVYAAFAKLAGVKNVPIKSAAALSTWADQTKRLVEEIRRG